MKLNRTAQRTVEILKLISKKTDGITLDEICVALCLPKTSAYDIVTTLVSMEMINVDKGQRQRYTIGLMAYRIGINYTNNLDFISAIEPELRSLAKEIGKTVFLGIPSDHEVVYLSKYEPENPIITTATVGTKNPMYCTSLGKAILAYTEEEERNRMISHIRFHPHTPRTICDQGTLLTELEAVKEQGYAIDDREIEDHMECVGAPVFGSGGNVIGAISASSLYVPTEDYHALGRTVSKRAKKVSRLLGFLEKL